MKGQKAIGACTLLALTLITATLRAQGPIQFKDLTVASGIGFVHEDGADKEGYLPSLMASGLALFDFDLDRQIDAYFLNGKSLNPDSSSQDHNALLRNQQLRFSDVSKESRTNVSRFSLGVAVADFDNDGFPDLAVSNLGSATLLHNRGDGTFDDVSEQSGLTRASIAFGAGVAFLDVENDGDLDLYLADYVEFTMERFQTAKRKTAPYPPGPEQFVHRADQLWINQGDGTFKNGSEAAGIAGRKSPSMGIVCGDFDKDNDTDIFVCSDARPNLFWVNDGKGHFTEEATLRGAALNANGQSVGSMGCEVGDVDNDGAEDIFITSYSTQAPILLKNSLDLGFEDVIATSRAGRDVIPHANWGSGLFDFDNDGDRDLWIGNGHLIKDVHILEQLTSYKVRNTLLTNDGKGVFTNVTSGAGDGLAVIESTRGMGFDDLDNDGDIDCIASNNDARANVLENRTPSNFHWIELELVGTKANRDGLGASVTIHSNQQTQFAEKRSGRAYQSHYGSRLHFGLGKLSRIDEIQVNWQGKIVRYSDLEVDRLHILLEPTSE